MPSLQRLFALLAVCGALLGAVAATHVSLARADGDPASDVLLGEPVFYPYTPPVTAATTRQLNATVVAANRAHFKLKVALIASPVDLGVLPDLFGKPQKYAQFLNQEITFSGARQPLLVVMKTGYGVDGVAPAVAAVAAALPKPADATSQALAQAALAAVPKLAAAAGAKVAAVAAPSAGHDTGSSGPNVALLVVLIGVALLAAGALVALRQRGARAGEAER